MMLGQVDVCVCAKSFQSCPTLQPLGFLCPWESPDNTGVGCHALLQGILLTGIEPASLMSPALADRFFTTNTTWEAPTHTHTHTHKNIKKQVIFTCLQTRSYLERPWGQKAMGLSFFLQDTASESYSVFVRFL